MEFTYRAYGNLIESILRNGYQITNYHDYRDIEHACILRHDVDMDLEKAVEFADFESKISCGRGRTLQSTYFILVTSDFYNPYSKDNIKRLRRIQACGHEIGLHFDEKKYMSVNDFDAEKLRQYVKKEAELLSDMIEAPVTTVSMHRPSAKFLQENFVFEDIINSYSQEFFHDFKYLSDSRMSWREDVEQIVKNRKASKLHLLTHPFWYSKERRSTREILIKFLNEAYKTRYDSMSENFSNLEEFVKVD